MRSQADRKRLARVVKILVVIAAATAATTNVATLNCNNRKCVCQLHFNAYFYKCMCVCGSVYVNCCHYLDDIATNFVCSCLLFAVMTVNVVIALTNKSTGKNMKNVRISKLPTHQSNS